MANSRRTRSALGALLASTLMLAGAAAAHAAPTITSPQTGDYVNDTTPTVKFAGVAPDRDINLEFLTVVGTTPAAEIIDGVGEVTALTPVSSGTPDRRVFLAVRESDGTGSMGPFDDVMVNIDQIPSFDVGDDDTTLDGETVTNERISFNVKDAIPGTVAATYIRLHIDGVSAVSDFEADASGAAQDISPYEDLPVGTHTAYLTTVDDAGVESSRSDEVTFTVADAPGQPEYKDLFDGAQLNQSQPVIELTGIDPAATKVTLYHVIDVNDIGTEVELPSSTTINASAGTATITPTLPDGLNGLVIKQTANGVETGDDAPGQSLPQLNVFVKTSAPTLSSNDDGKLTGEIPYFDVEGALESDGSGNNTNTVELYIDGKLAGSDDTDGGGNAGIRPLTVKDGAHTAYAVTRDDVGHLSTARSNTVTFTLDTTGPAAPALLSPANGSVITTNLPLVTVRAEPDARVYIIVDDIGEGGGPIADSNGNATLQLTKALADGPHTLLAQAVDAAGNLGELATVSFTVKTVVVAPPVPPTPPAPTDPKPPVTPATPATPTKVSLSSSTLTKSKPVTVKFTLKKAATVKVTITRTVKGKTVTVATVNVKYKKGGKVTYKLKTKVGGKTLKKGKYKMSLQTVNGKKKSKSVSAKVTVR